VLAEDHAHVIVKLDRSGKRLRVPHSLIYKAWHVG
jgi:hypothetical protein